MKYNIVIIGGGAAGLFFASSVKTEYGKVLLLERGERLGKKLSSTGNGQGNVTNVNVHKTPYFSFAEDGNARVQALLAKHGYEEMIAFLEGLGGLFCADERGRVYPTGRQASAVTDLLRFEVARRGVETSLSAFVKAVKRKGDGYLVVADTPQGERTFETEHVVLCTGGKAAKNFGSDGNGYALARAFSHTITPLYPALVQLKTDTKHTKTLKGIRVNGAMLAAKVDGKQVAAAKGDVIFTDYGVSGDAVFRISSFVTAVAESGRASLSIDLLPEISEEKLIAVLQEKQNNYPSIAEGELLCGILNNQVGRAVMKRCQGQSMVAVAACVKAFTLPVVGTLGFDYAQVTKGGVRLDEVTDGMESIFAKGFYLIGEVLDVDGECGGYNLQWAYASARACADEFDGKNAKARGRG